MTDLFTLSGEYVDDSYGLETEIRTLREEIQTLDGQLRQLRKELVTHDHVRKSPEKVSIQEVISIVEKEMENTEEVKE